MNKKYIIITGILVFIAIIVLTFINNLNKSSTDSYKFKNEYEEINGKKNFHKMINRTVNISKENPIEYISAKKLVDKINKKETFAVYFGFADCPWCRSVVENIIIAAKNKNINTIYYLDVKEIRDVKELKENKVVTVTKGNKYYMEILTKLDKVLADYTLEDSDGKKIILEEKRIYAPNIVSIVDGEAKELTDGISEKEKDPYMKLTKDMNNESIKKIECTLNCLNESNVCTSKTSC